MRFAELTEEAHSYDSKVGPKVYKDSQLAKLVRKRGIASLKGRVYTTKQVYGFDQLLVNIPETRTPLKSFCELLKKEEKQHDNVGDMRTIIIDDGTVQASVIIDIEECKIYSGRTIVDPPIGWLEHEHMFKRGHFELLSLKAEPDMELLDDVIKQKELILTFDGIHIYDIKPALIDFAINQVRKRLTQDKPADAGGNLKLYTDEDGCHLVVFNPAERAVYFYVYLSLRVGSYNGKHIGPSYVTIKLLEHCKFEMIDYDASPALLKTMIASGDAFRIPQFEYSD